MFVAQGQFIWTPLIWTPFIWTPFSWFLERRHVCSLHIVASAHCRFRTLSLPHIVAWHTVAWHIVAWHIVAWHIVAWDMSGFSRQHMSGFSRQHMSGFAREHMSGFSRQHTSGFSRQHMSGLPRTQKMSGIGHEHGRHGSPRAHIESLRSHGLQGVF